MFTLIISALLLAFLISFYKIYKGYSVLEATPAYVPKRRRLPVNPKPDLTGFPIYFF